MKKMIFETLGEKSNPAILFFHAMGVTGASSKPVADCLKDRYFCILPTSTVYCSGQKYRSKADEVRQVEEFLRQQELSRIVCRSYHFCNNIFLTVGESVSPSFSDSVASMENHIPLS